MNIIIKEELFDQLYRTVLAYEAELNETVKCLHAEDEISSMESTIVNLQELARFCYRIKQASRHGRDIKGQRN